MAATLPTVAAPVAAAAAVAEVVDSQAVAVVAAAAAAAEGWHGTVLWFSCCRLQPAKSTRTCKAVSYPALFCMYNTCTCTMCAGEQVPLLLTSDYMMVDMMA